ncbi:hypothetical protein GOODEAATRI_002744 [Goodea atripinnis]|uniref:Uncharacterized protein n=1 Tax=Goodea atripinnis TaxID=208336 RepID=A0ABV0PKQ5_9TELE
MPVCLAKCFHFHICNCFHLPAYGSETRIWNNGLQITSLKRRMLILIDPPVELGNKQRWPSHAAFPTPLQLEEERGEERKHPWLNHFYVFFTSEIYMRLPRAPQLQKNKLFSLSLLLGKQ